MGSVTVPEVASSVTRLVEFTEHLDLLQKTPSEEVDMALIDHVYLQLNSSNMSPLIPLLLPRLAALLQVYTHDIDPLAHFTTKLIQSLKLGEIKTLLGDEGASRLETLIIAALSSHSPAANKLGFVLITACAREGRLSIHRMMEAPSLIETFIYVWLCASDAGVGAEATKALLNLLDVDKSTDDASSVVWDKLFSPSCQRTIYDRCMVQTIDDKATRGQKTLAQGRLLEALPCMVLLNPDMPIRSLPGTDWVTLISTGDPREPYPGEPSDSLIHVAALHMVDPDDFPMVTLIVRFWEQLILALDKAKLDPISPLGQKYAHVLSVVVSGTSIRSTKITDALVSLPMRFEEKEVQDRIANLLRGILFNSAEHVVTRSP